MGAFDIKKGLLALSGKVSCKMISEELPLSDAQKAADI